jgi:DNA-binding MurR/RpiR family transcriptional regulator
MDKSARFRSVDCLTIIEQRLPALSGASRQVAEAIVRDPWAVLGMTIYDVAEMSKVSLPSVTRFCRAVGFGGFRELVQGIAQSLGRIDSKDFESLHDHDGHEGGIKTLAETIVKRQVEALQTTLHALDYDAIERATQLIADARRVVILGHGAAQVPALGLSVKLMWGGVAAFEAAPDMFSNIVITSQPGDVVIGVSHQGRTRDTIELLRLARKFGATTIGISTVPNSPLAEVSDVSLAVLSPDVARAGTFLIAFDALMVLADILAATVSDCKWKGDPPNRSDVVEWIERNLRVGPSTFGESRHARRVPNG